MNITGYKKSKKGMIIMLRKEKNKGRDGSERKIERLERAIASCNDKIRMLKVKRKK